MEHKGSLLCTQNPTTGPYPEPDESQPPLCPRPHVTFHNRLFFFFWGGGWGLSPPSWRSTHCWLLNIFAATLHISPHLLCQGDKGHDTVAHFDAGPYVSLAFTRSISTQPAAANQITQYETTNEREQHELTGLIVLMVLYFGESRQVTLNINSADKNWNNGGVTTSDTLHENRKTALQLRGPKQILCSAARNGSGNNRTGS
jgi:hypothetical protein